MTHRRVLRPLGSFRNNWVQTWLRLFLPKVTARPGDDLWSRIVGRSHDPSVTSTGSSLPNIELIVEVVYSVRIQIKALLDCLLLPSSPSPSDNSVGRSRSTDFPPVQVHNTSLLDSGQQVKSSGCHSWTSSSVPGFPSPLRRSREQRSPSSIS